MKACVIGAGLGGLAAGLRLRAAGHEVVVLEQGAAPCGRAGRIRDAGFTWDTGPSLLTMPWVLEELFAADDRDLWFAMVIARFVNLPDTLAALGYPVPWDPEHVFYVWFDALLNYYSALSYARPGEDLTELFWPPSYHLIAKDILRFHAVYWPALLMAADIELPERIFAHGYLLMGGEKMSKSLGNVLDPFAAIERFGADALRFYLLREVPFGQDGSVSSSAFEQRYESELANELGNLASRVTSMVGRYLSGRIGDGALSAGSSAAALAKPQPRGFSVRIHSPSASKVASRRSPGASSGTPSRYAVRRPRHDGIDRSRRSTPSTSMPPDSGSYSRHRSLASVVLPAPFCPTIASDVPAGMARSKCSSTGGPPG